MLPVLSTLPLPRPPVVDVSSRSYRGGPSSFPLARLQRLPALHSLVLALHVIPPSEKAAEEKDEKDEKSDAAAGDEPALSQLSSISTLRWLACTGAQCWWGHEQPLPHSAEMAFIAALFGPPAAQQPAASSLQRLPALRLESLIFELTLTYTAGVDAGMEGIARYFDPTTCRHLSCSITMRVQDKARVQPYSAANINPAIFVDAHQLRHLAPPSQPSRSDQAYYITVSPLSADCIAAIDQYNEQEQVEAAPRSSELYHSTMLSQLSAANHGRPRWATDARINRLLDPERVFPWSSGFGKLPSRRISSSGLWHIVHRPKRTQKRERQG